MTEFNKISKLDRILETAAKGDGLDDDAIHFLLDLDDETHLDRLFATARHLREMHFGSKIFLYGFLYISTYCRNDCNFCFYRKSNRESLRYRKDREEILEAARGLAGTGVHLIDLTMGEDPVLLDRQMEGGDWLVDIAAMVRETTGLPVMASLGMIDPNLMRQLADAGVIWYACYQETHNRSLFERLRPGQNYDKRLNTKMTAHEMGMLVEEGLLGGVGESNDDVSESIAMMRRIDADQIRIMNFVPQTGTPMVACKPPNPRRELKVVSIMRLAFPDRLIPASLDVDGLAGLNNRLDAGANVITSLVPPGQGLAGVAQSSLDIEEGNRTADSVAAILGEKDLQTATVREYESWIQSRRNSLNKV